MRATQNLTFTPWQAGRPARPGWYIASAERNDERHAYFDGRRWSAQVAEDASYAEHDRAQAVPMAPALARRLEWRGLTADSAAWFAAESEARPVA